MPAFGACMFVFVVEEVQTFVFICAKLIISLLGGFGQPFAGIVAWRVIPPERKIGGAELLFGQRYRVEKLIVDIGEAISTFAVDARNIECVAVFPAGGKVIVKAHPAILKPPEALELAFRQVARRGAEAA